MTVNIFVQFKIREISAIRLIRDSDLVPRDRLRKGKILPPLIIFIYCLILKGAILDGWHGWYYRFFESFSRTIAGYTYNRSREIETLYF
jgi:hypothetical protein